MSITVVVQICSVILYYICQYMRFSNCVGHTTNNNAITAPKYIILRSSVLRKCTNNTNKLILFDFGVYLFDNAFFSRLNLLCTKQRFI